MDDLRKVMGWAFAISIFPSIWLAYRTIRFITHTHHSLLQPRGLILGGFFPVLACVYLVAWLTYWMRRPSARVWGITASLTYILIAVIEFLSARRHLGTVVIMGTAGIAGLMVFLRNTEPESEANRSALQQPSV
jgi:hypothetical protein